jgi:hypothetical protein
MRRRARRGGVAVGSTVHPAHVDADALVPALQQNAEQSPAVAQPNIWAANLLKILSGQNVRVGACGWLKVMTSSPEGFGEAARKLETPTGL